MNFFFFFFDDFSLQISGETLLQIINDLLDLAKMDSGKFILEQKSFSLTECIEGVFDLLATQAKEKEVELYYTLSKDVPLTLIGDVLRLRQVFLNLISNAIKFSRKGFVFLKCFKSKETNEGCQNEEFELRSSEDTFLLNFQVIDDGIGIPNEKLSELFQPFSQVCSFLFFSFLFSYFFFPSFLFFSFHIFRYDLFEFFFFFP